MKKRIIKMEPLIDQVKKILEARLKGKSKKENK